MRPDMFEVIIERPRVGSGWRRTPDRPKRFDEDLPPPSCVSMSRGRDGTRYLNENLKPLARFLRGCVGRPWNKVYSEICAQIDVNSAVQKHVRDHLKDLVELHAFERDGKVWGQGWTGPFELGRWGRDELYVCPRTGLLRLVKGRPRRVPVPPLVRFASETAGWIRLEAGWFVLGFAKIPLDGATFVRDVVLARWLPTGRFSNARDVSLRRLYGRSDLYCVSKRQLSRKEILRAGLRES